MQNKLTRLLAVMAFLSLATTSHAIAVSSQDCSPTGDNRTITIDSGLACIAKGSGNNNNNSTFQAAVVGWSWIGTEEEGVNASAFNVTLDATVGTLTLNAGLWDTYSDILVVLKVGAANGRALDPDWALFSLESGLYSYNYSVTPPQGGALSHASLYGRITQVPEPGTLAILGLGLFGLDLVKRKRRG